MVTEQAELFKISPFFHSFVLFLGMVLCVTLRSHFFFFLPLSLFIVFFYRSSVCSQQIIINSMPSFRAAFFLQFFFFFHLLLCLHCIANVRIYLTLFHRFFEPFVVILFLCMVLAWWWNATNFQQLLFNHNDGFANIVSL